MLQQLFIGNNHVEQRSKFVRELLEHKSRTTSDVIVNLMVGCFLHIPYS